MAYKVSYKVVSEQGEQLKNISKDMDNYINQLSQITSKLGDDELLQSVRSDLNKFKKQLEEEKTVLNLAGQVIVDVIQAYTGVEKKSVGKVDKAKAHNRDFYKRPVAVASAGGTAAAGSAASASATVISSQGAAPSSSVNVSTSVIQNNISNTTNIYNTSAGADLADASAAPDLISVGAGVGTQPGTAAAVGSAVAAAGGLAVAGASLAKEDKDEDPDKDQE